MTGLLSDDPLQQPHRQALELKASTRALRYVSAVLLSIELQTIQSESVESHSVRDLAGPGASGRSDYDG